LQIIYGLILISGYKGLDFVLRFLAKAMLKQAYHYSYDLTKTLNFMLFYANSLFIPYPHTPSLSPSPVRGMFRFGDMVSVVCNQTYKKNEGLGSTPK